MDDIIAACMNYEGGICEVEDFPVNRIPVHLLGKSYSTEKNLEELRLDYQSRIWMTYRRNFCAIEKTEYTSDKGWGCMLRCGQMVVAEALARINLGREWIWKQEEKNEVYLKIISLFEDKPERPFSIHQIAKTGEAPERNINIGDWMGPNTIANVLKKLVPLEKWCHMNINVIRDNIFIIDEMKQSGFDENTKLWKPLILFVPLRLGVTEVNSIYKSSLQKCFKMPQSLGIIGGKPNHALYFIGSVGEELIYLDPHTTQDFGEVGSKDTEENIQIDSSYHCKFGHRMHMDYLDPSLALCFLCSTEKDFDDLCNRLRQEITNGEGSPLFELLPTRPHYMTEESEIDLDKFSADMELNDDHNLYSEDDEFEILE